MKRDSKVEALDTSLHEVVIERLAAGGDGIAHLADGITVFVPFTAPGDRVSIRLTTRRKRFARAVVETLIEPGAGRCEPRCAVFGRCGGCTWQHLSYAQQIDAKREILRDALERIGRLELPGPIEIEPSPEPYGYRGRARLLVRGDAVGYRERSTHALCAIERCPVLAPEIEAALAARALRPEPSETQSEREWHVVLGSDGRIASRETDLESPRSSENAAESFIALAVGSESMTVSAGSFAQANILMLDVLMQAAVDAVTESRDKVHDAVLLELHAGAGYFTLPLARAFARVHAVEASPSAVKDLRRNLAAAKLSNVDVTLARVEHVLASPPSPRPDVVLLDPPRSGLGLESAEALAGLGASRIAYVSCDPATLARDLAVICARGYRLEAVRGFDLFPQTPHVEALAVLAL